MTGNTVVNRDKPPAFIELIFEEAEGYIKYIYMLDHGKCGVGKIQQKMGERM